MGKPRVKYLVVHTSASRQAGVDASVIDQWHKDNGWRKIGYHYVIIGNNHPSFRDGHVQTGRRLDEIGAHTRGINSISLGICCVGHGDHNDFTNAQKEALTKLLAQLVRQFRVPVANIIGHRDINMLIARGLVSDQYHTDKSCPGSKVKLTRIRARVETQLRRTSVITPVAGRPSSNITSTKRLRAGIKLVERHVRNAPNAKNAWDEFKNHPEIRDLMNQGEKN